MAEPFLSEIRIMSCNFPPKGWALCNGQLLPINQNQPLFSLLGTTYGGDGRVNFALPDLRGRVPIHMGAGVTLGERAGQTAVTLSISQLPLHQHQMQARAETPPIAIGNMAGGSKVPAQGLVSLPANATAPVSLYGNPVNLVPMAPQFIGNAGGSQAHNNMMPYLTLTFCIALQGIFPSMT